MVRSKKTKNAPAKLAALLTALVILVVSLACIPGWSPGFMPYLGNVGVACGSPLSARLLYSFFHASPLHAIVNVWCLLSIVFIYDVSVFRLLTAYVVAVLAPCFLLSDVPTVGLSCVCWFLLGSLIFQVRRKIWFLSCMALYLAVGFLFPSVNALIHIYGYLAGLLVGLLNAPLSCFRRG